MSHRTQLELSGYRAGRCLLWVALVRRNRHQMKAALRGIGRELTGALNDAAATALDCLATLEGE